MARDSLTSSTGVRDKSISTGSVTGSSSDVQTYDSRSFWSPGTYPVHEPMSIFSIVSRGQHFVTFAQDTRVQEAHTTTKKAAHVSVDILLRRCSRPEMDHAGGGEVSQCVLRSILRRLGTSSTVTSGRRFRVRAAATAAVVAS